LERFENGTTARAEGGNCTPAQQVGKSTAEGDSREGVTLKPPSTGGGGGRESAGRREKRKVQLVTQGLGLNRKIQSKGGTDFRDVLASAGSSHSFGRRARGGWGEEGKRYSCRSLGFGPS